MAREKLGKKKCTVAFPPEMIEEIKAEAAKEGMQWTTLVPALCRVGLNLRKKAAA